MIILKFLRTFISYILVFCLILIIIIPALIMFLLPSKCRYDNRLFYFIANIFYKGSLKATFLPIEIIGKENIPNEPVIFASNHQSAMDIPLVGTVVGKRHHVWMAWSELTKYLFIGPVISRIAVLVDTSGPVKAMRSLLKAIELAKEGDKSIIIFPEGSRSEGNQVTEFFSGFVMLAKKTEMPVVPILLLNANKAYPVGSFFINWYPVKVIIGKPVLYSDFGQDEAFKNFVHSWFVENVNEFEARKK